MTHSAKDLVALGDTSKQVLLVDLRTKDPSAARGKGGVPNKTTMKLQGHLGSVTCIKSLNENELVTGARGDGLLYLWDLRKPDTFSECWFREYHGNQRMHFDLERDKNVLLFGEADGNITLQDIRRKENSTKLKVGGTGGVINSVGILPSQGSDLHVLASEGERVFSFGQEGKLSQKLGRKVSTTPQDDSSEWSEDSGCDEVPPRIKMVNEGPKHSLASQGKLRAGNWQHQFATTGLKVSVPEPRSN